MVNKSIADKYSKLANGSETCNINRHHKFMGKIIYIRDALRHEKSYSQKRNRTSYGKPSSCPTTLTLSTGTLEKWSRTPTST